jgi:hypothetical protein
MSELKQKKVARDSQITKANQEAAKKSATDAEALNKAITERAKAYETEYHNVSRPLFFFYCL